MDSRLVAANNDFGFRLSAHLVKRDTDKNVFVSPSSIAIALAMTYNGAEGTTKQALAETLGVGGMTLQEVNEANAALRVTLASLDPKVQLAIANSLWAKEGLEFKPDFIRRNKDFYGAKVTNLNFTDPSALLTINGWVKERTNGKIDKLVKPEDLDILTVLILINAIYFKGIWTVQFDKAKTEEGVFVLLDGSRKKHPMMSQSGRYTYYKGENFQAVSLPYGEGRISMYVFLPDKTTTLSEFQKSLDARNWEAWMHQFDETEGDVVLPRFKVEYEAELNDALTALGMGVAFTSKANFRGMCARPLFISKVRHKTFMEVNEEGTEAAASTAVIMKRLSPPQKFKMVVDRPFFCAIRDNKTGTVLFMGSIVEPK